MNPRLRRALEVSAVPAFWLAVAMLAIAAGRHHFTHAGQALHLIASYLGWAALTPLVFLAARRFPLSAGRRLRSLAAHVVLGSIVAVAWRVYFEYSHSFLEHPERRNPGLDEVLFERVWSGYGSALLIYAGVLLAALGIDHYSRYRRLENQRLALRAELSEARLSALTLQLQPHFLFNTLNSISGLVESDPDAARTIVARLSEVLRSGLDRDRSPEVPLSNELRMLDPYLDILRIRLGGALEIRTEIDPDALSALVPPLVLQPLVENAFDHGVMRRLGPGRIVIRCERKGERVVLEVVDSGEGNRSEARGGGGLALSNIRARLSQLYQEAGALTLVVDGSEGTVARVTLPYREASTNPTETATTGTGVLPSPRGHAPDQDS